MRERQIGLILAVAGVIGAALALPGSAYTVGLVRAAVVVAGTSFIMALCRITAEEHAE